MHFTDTHTHPYTEQFSHDRDAAMLRAIQDGVTRMIVPNCSPDTIRPVKVLAEEYPDNVRIAMGLHPTDINPECWQEQLAATIGELQRGGYIAVGEVGMDLYWEKKYVDIQMQVFDRQLQVASELNLPVIIHCREALPQTLEVVKGHPKVRCDFHCFTGTTADVEAIRTLGDYYFGIGGVLTYKNSGLKDTLPAIGIERILLETDAPYLAPVPWRGKRNEPAYIVATAQAVADTLQIPITEVAARTAKNSVDLFGF